MKSFRQIHTRTYVRCGEQIVYPAHIHSYVELVYAWEGGFDACIDGVNYKIGKGDMLLVFPNCVHFFSSQTEGKFLCAVFSVDDVPPFREELISRRPQNPIIRKNEIPETVLPMLGLLSNKGVMEEKWFAGVMTAVMALVIPKTEAEVSKGTDGTREILWYCLDHYREPISLYDLSRAMHISQSRLSHIFKEKIGISFKGYINYLRVHDACKMLLSTRKSVSDIAMLVGFDSIRSFNRNFLSVMGCTPSKYRSETKTDSFIKN